MSRPEEVISTQLVDERLPSNWDSLSFFSINVCRNREAWLCRSCPSPPELGGVPRCIWSSYNAYEEAMRVADCPNVDLRFRIGCWLEDGVLTGKSVEESLRKFGEQGKTLTIHFRNDDRPLPRFVETFVDDNCSDMQRQ